MPAGATRRPDVSVVSTGHDVADARLHRICAALLRRGLSVEVVGLGTAVGGPRDVTEREVPASERPVGLASTSGTMKCQARIVAGTCEAIISREDPVIGRPSAITGTSVIVRNRTEQGSGRAAPASGTTATCRGQRVRSR